MEEKTGVIKLIYNDRGFGFIKTDISEDIYFKTNKSTEELQKDDHVAFLLNRKNGKTSATAVRKIYTNNQGVLFIPRVNSFHIHSGVEKYLPQVFNSINLQDQEFIVEQVDFEEPVGKSILVPTTESDKIIYAIRKGRQNYSRFVLNREPVDSSSITIVLKKMDTYYMIISCFVGEKAQPEPWDPKSTSESLLFWSQNALIFGSEPIKEGTETDVCPVSFNEKIKIQ